MTVYRIVRDGKAIACVKASDINACREVVRTNFIDTSRLSIEETRRDSVGAWVWTWAVDYLPAKP